MFKLDSLFFFIITDYFPKWISEFYLLGQLSIIFKDVCTQIKSQEDLL